MYQLMRSIEYIHLAIGFGDYKIIRTVEVYLSALECLVAFVDVIRDIRIILYFFSGKSEHRIGKSVKGILINVSRSVIRFIFGIG